MATKQAKKQANEDDFDFERAQAAINGFGGAVDADVEIDGWFTQDTTRIIMGRVVRAFALKKGGRAVLIKTSHAWKTADKDGNVQSFPKGTVCGVVLRHKIERLFGAVGWDVAILYKGVKQLDGGRKLSLFDVSYKTPDGKPAIPDLPDGPADSNGEVEVPGDDEVPF